MYLLMMSVHTRKHANMIISIEGIRVLLFGATLIAIFGVSCNAGRGFGKDVQNLGEGIQNATK